MTNNLKLYVAQKNRMAKFFGRSEYDINNLTRMDLRELKESVECELSPENLHCDGEISRAQAAKKKKFFDLVLSEINEIL